MATVLRAEPQPTRTSGATWFLLTAGLFVAGGAAWTWSISPLWLALSFGVICALGIQIVGTDSKNRLILNTTVLALGLGSFVSIGLGVATGVLGVGDLLRMVTAVAAVSIINVVLFLCGQTSPGDVKLSAVLMLSTGALGWQAAVLGFALPYFFALPQVLVTRWRLRGQKTIPFGPYLVAGTAVALLVCGWLI